MPSQRFSFQRERIYEAVYESKAHPSAEMVYDRLKPGMPHLSLGTVYRNLRQMARDGRLMELDGPVVRFDANTEPHTHLRCACCGALSDMTLPYDPELDTKAGQEGYTVLHHSLLFMGICPACAGEKHTTKDQII